MFGMLHAFMCTHVSRFHRMIVSPHFIFLVNQGYVNVGGSRMANVPFALRISGLLVLEDNRIRGSRRRRERAR